MLEPVSRRQANPQFAVQLWQAIPYIRQQKQVCNHERLFKYMQRNFHTGVEEMKTQLEYVKVDNLITVYTATSQKGSHVGNEQEGYKLPDPNNIEKDGHDWYCFVCHREGDVLPCEECWRVYHIKCTDDEIKDNSLVCSVCLAIKKQPRMKRKQMNKLLSFTINRLKIKAKDLYAEDQKVLDLVQGCLVYTPMTLSKMEDKTLERKYKYLEQFMADASTVVHNTFLCFGETSPLAETAKLMIRDCRYDLDEIRQCKDCYYYSNATPKDWFCLPCDPPHELVFAKQKGYSFWPAKVISKTKEGYDVRFFGNRHERAILPEASIKPIDADFKAIGIKRTASFCKAFDELNLHRSYLDDTVNRHNAEGDDDADETETEAPPTPMEEDNDEPPPVKHKKFRTKPKDEEVSSTGAHRKHADSSPSEADLNQVTSSDMSPPMLTDSGSQTPGKLINDSLVASSTQTDQTAEAATSTEKEAGSVPIATVRPFSDTCGCNCEKEFALKLDAAREEFETEKKRSITVLETKLRKDFQAEKKEALRAAQAQHAKELEKMKKTIDERVGQQLQEEVKKAVAKHKAEISGIKKKQWCYNCEEEAMYHCCWNTSYCSIKCQQDHWHREHKRMCRRKRP